MFDSFITLSMAMVYGSIKGWLENLNTLTGRDTLLTGGQVSIPLPPCGVGEV